MATSAPPQSEATAPSGRLLALVAAPVRRRPLAIALVLGAAATSGIIALFVLAPTSETAKPTLDDALAALDAGENRRAEQLAARLESAGKLSTADWGGPPLVLGVVAAREAAEFDEPQHRRFQFRMAARYLEESRRRGWIEGRRGQGVFQLGVCLFESGRFADSIAVLGEALEMNPAERRHLLDLLADAHLRAPQPDPERALSYSARYLNLGGLSARDHQRAKLRESRALLSLGRIEEARERLTAIPADSTWSDAAELVRAQLLIAEDRPAEAQQALSDLPPFASAENARRAEYLTAVCLRAAGEQDEAEEAFARLRDKYEGSPEALAASLRGAEVQLEAGKNVAAVESFRRAAREAGPPHLYSNRWISLDQLRDRALEAYERLSERGEHQLAAQLAESLPPVIAQDRGETMQAAAYRAAADQRLLAAEDQPPLEAETTQAEAFGHLRRVGDLMARVARRRAATRDYPDDLWSSAEAYRRGRHWPEALRQYRRYLDLEPQSRRPEALAACGEALLGLGKFADALAPLEDCIEFHPKHPASYRARLLAARVHLERNESAAARRLLLENMHHESLTPQSVEWRDSLYMLGRAFYREGRQHEAESRRLGMDAADAEARGRASDALEKSHEAFSSAVEQLTTFVRRYPEAPQVGLARYTLADAGREAAKWLRKRTEDIAIESARAAVRRDMEQMLQKAIAEYEAVIETTTQWKLERELSSAEHKLLRNSQFGRADCLFDLERYDDAIAAYTEVANQHHREPVVLEALVQIGACHRRLGADAEARGALEKAKLVLERLPEDTDFTSTTRYDREGWTNLLNWLAAE